MKKQTISTDQSAYLAYIDDHPGCSVADVDRACRRNPRAGHRWVYDGVRRLVRRGLVEATGTNPLALRVTGDGLVALSLHNNLVQPTASEGK